MEPTEKQSLIYRILFPYEHEKITSIKCCADIRTEVQNLIKTQRMLILVILARSLDIYLKPDDLMHNIANKIIREICPTENPSLIKLWARYAKITTEQEKVSDPNTDWTEEMHEVYAAGNWRRFSELRGYTEQEMDDFNEYIRLTNKVEEIYGYGDDDNFTLNIINAVNEGDFSYDDIINDKIDVFID
jgi:hypothetical protein